MKDNGSNEMDSIVIDWRDSLYKVKLFNIYKCNLFYADGLTYRGSMAYVYFDYPPSKVLFNFVGHMDILVELHELNPININIAIELMKDSFGNDGFEVLYYSDYCLLAKVI